ncbi:MAG TPA: RagB/SusD family nutrient uptake outer membrane protein [Bacteroidales bacterium]|nr:RagB/SusD family nutrient uptake outer membrane protein [Bacteroidales bacterium]
MKSIFNKTPWILTVLILLQISCSEDWLRPEPLSFYAPENVFVNEEGFQSLLVTMRLDVRTDGFYINFSTFENQYCLSDLGVPGPINKAVIKDFITQLTPAGDGNKENFQQLYDIAYKAIKTTNLLISRIDDITWKDETIRNEMLAEAYFFRSYWYYRLIHSFGDVPFTGSEIKDAKLDFYTHSRWTILNKIISDMEFAVEWLPVKAVPGAATRGAGDHLLTKIYLANSDFDEAIESASRVINGPYALMKNRFGNSANDPIRNVVWDLFRPENIAIPQNTENLFSVVDRFEAPDAAKTAGCRKARAFVPAWWHVSVKDSKGKNGTILAGPMYDTLLNSNAQCRPTPFYIYEAWADGTYNWRNTPDLRRSNICWVDKEELRYNRTTSVDFGKPVNPNYFTSLNDTFQYYFSFPQYKTYYPVQDPSNLNSSGGNGDSYVFRLAETYLLRAEAYFWKSDLVNAAKDINEVRDRANALPVLPADVTIDYIMDERARELYSEEPRHNELVRVSYIMAKNNISGYSLENFSEHNYFYDRVMRLNVFFKTNFVWGGDPYRIAPWNVLFPIPVTVITANTKGVINQNQGYYGTENNLPPLETIKE